MQYYGDVYRPPSEARSLIIQVTLGCSHNTCAFCTMYKEKRFYNRPLQDVLEDLREVSSRYAAMVKRIFLADGDALIRKTDDLLVILDEIQKLYPNCERVTTYASPGSLLAKKEEELKTLKEHGLTMVYLGLESGSDEVLKLMRKGFTAAQIVEGGLKAKRAGMQLSVTAIAGLGGKKLTKEHAEGTAKALTAMNPDFLGVLTLEIHEGTPLQQWVENGSFELLDSMEILQETRSLVEQMDCPGCVFRMNHASNYLMLGGTLNEDKEDLLKEIDAAIAGQVKLRPEWARRF
ncbi:MAG: radical SAM protein [Lachnospiraceae bacterium]|nr:radical SAM protein [Lachnospiraceae bacterium]